MAVYNTHVARTTTGSDPLVPEPLAAAIIQEAPKASAALSLMNRTLLSAKTQRMPVLDVLPVAYWVGGDVGMKQTSQQAWKNVVMVVEELACIVPIPEAYMDDADVPIWSEVQPRITEAVGALIDSAVLWGVNKPVTWGESVFVGAGKSGNWVTEGTGVDLGQDVSNLGLAMARTGYTVNGFAAMPGMSWKLTGMRSATGLPIYQSDLTASPTGRGLYGYPLSEVNNGSWNFGLTGAEILMGDFTKSIIGIRKDISFKMFDQGVISNDSGVVIMNLMQQDTVAMRMTMRLAYATVNPVTIMQPGQTITQRWPFGMILPVGASAPAGGAISVIQAPPYPYTGAFMADPAAQGEAMGYSDEDVAAVEEAADRPFVETDESQQEFAEERERAQLRGGGQEPQRGRSARGSQKRGAEGTESAVERGAERGSERGSERGAERGAERGVERGQGKRTE
jgi:HK97 family phage major capsid protein